MKQIKIKCPAKINLTLEILNKREDGFHNIQSVMQTINLFDFLTIKIEESENFEINLSGTSDEIPYDERNLVYKAAELFFKATPHPQPISHKGRGEKCAQPKQAFQQLLSQRAKNLREKATLPEEILWYYLRDRRFLNLKFRRQVPIKKYIADFVCYEKKIIIELDGSEHLEDKNIKYDKQRDMFLKNQGFEVLRFYNTDIFNNIENVLEKIYQTLFTDAVGILLPSVGEGGGTPDEGGDYKISVHIEKNIPISAGLAGGSTDAAGTIFGLNKLLNNPLSQNELHEICAKLGSDLNFCLEGGCQLTTGRGEILEPLLYQEFRLALIKPKNLGISAKEAYTKFSELKNKPNLNMTAKIVKALKSNQNIEDYLHNDLEIALIDDYEQLREIKMEYPESIMSGSGSTFFVLNEDFKDFSEDFWIKNGLKSIPYGVCEEKD